MDVSDGAGGLTTRSRPVRRPPGAAGAALKAVLRAAVDFIYPRGCPLCQREDERVASAPLARPAFCEQCRTDLWPDNDDSCPRCGAPAGPHLDVTKGCHHCRGDRFAFESVIRFGMYRDALRSVCLQAKRPSGEAAAAAAAALLWDHSSERLGQAGAQLVVPVPAHWTGRLRRTGRPAETIAAVLARCLRVPLGRDILRKVRRTPRQASLPPSRRRTNLRNAFRVRDAAAVTGRSVLLVDDILTTGTTAHEAARPILAAGAGRVVVAVIARGLGQT